MESAKTTNPVKQWRQQNSQKPSTHKPISKTHPQSFISRHLQSTKIELLDMELLLGGDQGGR